LNFDFVESKKKKNKAFRGNPNNIVHTGMLLSKSIVGEEHSIDTPAIKILTKLAAGEEAKQPLDILGTGVTIDLPSSFCLAKETADGVCNAPVGISAVVYSQNPVVSIIA
jgi:hypothetical protein